ncbi:hypothetical protein ACFRNT_14270 [Streptomyces sp. NPDC056697]|uniref:hypothetical protein n=1 Tax=Streptomyces sp. NPDC056697 TaxID=3345915 RepID=UPI003678B9E9
MHQPTAEQRERLRQAEIRSSECYAAVAQARAELAEAEHAYTVAHIELSRAIAGVLTGDTTRSSTP